MKFMKFLLLLYFFQFSNKAKAQTANNILKGWPEQASPEIIGKRLSERFVNNAHFNYGRPGPPKIIYYPEVCTWYGSLAFASLSHDQVLQAKLTDRFKPFFKEEAALVPVPNHVDFSVFGIIPLELYKQQKEKRYLDMGLHFADQQWNPDSAGLSWQTRFWIDDMYMINALQVQAYRVTGNDKYINRAANEMVVYLDKLQQKNGLFYHAPDAPFFWGRGNGWMAAGMTELLSALPAENKDHGRILQGYQTMMASLLKYQTKQGVWLQLIDDTGSWAETSGSAMFTFAMITGVKNGWLNQHTYGPATRKAWLALVKYIDANGDVTEVCEGTDKMNNRQHYLSRKRISGDLHGQAPMLWCAAALLK
jgi:unsaturated rhamnogalacturonyl hydrolase